jgi:hypothetical protein
MRRCADPEQRSNYFWCSRANGKAVPISSLKPGEKVLATDTRTGKTRAETIAAVLVHHDTNLYDLTIKANGRTAVIDTPPPTTTCFGTPPPDAGSKPPPSNTAPTCAPPTATPPAS